MVEKNLSTRLYKKFSMRVSAKASYHHTPAKQLCFKHHHWDTVACLTCGRKFCRACNSCEHKQICQFKCKACLVPRIKACNCGTDHQGCEEAVIGYIINNVWDALKHSNLKRLSDKTRSLQLPRYVKGLPLVDCQRVAKTTCRHKNCVRHAYLEQLRERLASRIRQGECIYRACTIVGIPGYFVR